MQLFLGHSMEFGWRFFTTIVILHLTVCLTSICIVTAASIKPPGETTSSIEIAIGDSANITCNITKVFNISSIWFSEENTKRKIVQPSSDITILGDQTAILTIRNASEYQGPYQCMSGNNAIGITKVYVGTPPTNVSNFMCRGYDYVYMTCIFTKPANKVFVKYELFYKSDADSPSYSYSCDLQTTEHTKFCNMTSQSKPVYLINRPIYVFKLTGTNALGSNSQEFRIKHFESVIPAKLNVLLRHITSDSVSLSWQIIKYAHYEEQGLEYEIRLQPKGFKWYYATDYEQCKSVYCNVTIKNLTYPYREYTVRVRVKVKAAEDDDTMWSEPYIGTFRTEPRRPDGPPKTAVGSFYIDPTETYIRLYWQQLTEYEENGPDFHYVINKTDLDGNFIETKRTKEASITFAWNRGEKCNYHIKSCNSLGESERSSQIRVHPIIRDEYFPQTIATVYHNRTYTLSWKPPINQYELINYTIFWCLSKMESPNQCKGTIHFRYLVKHATNFTTEPQDHTLNLAVSANYRSSITGMQWAMCSADVSSDLMKLEPEAAAESASTIKVHWSSERVCTSILKGYNLTYCLVPQNASTIEKTQATCWNTISKTVQLRGQREYIIENLKPYSKYRIDMFMYSETKVGPTSDPIYVRTKEAAPSAPRNLQVVAASITSKSANISWLPPLESNGEIKFYTIWKIKKQTKEHKDHQILYINETNTSNGTYSPIYFELKSLNSYSEYEVYVTAHTVESSENSNSTFLKTLIGIPTNPLNVNIIAEDSYGILKWQTPEMPSGRVDFYVVALIIKYKGKEDEDRQISLVNGQRCKFRFPECFDTINYYYLKVRAVNVAQKHEIDHSTFPNTKPNRRRRRRHSNPEISSTVGGGLQTYQSDILSSHDPLFVIDAKYNEKQKNPLQVKDSTVEYNDDDNSEQSNFQCLDTVSPIDEKYVIYTKHLNDVVGSVNDDIKFFSSPWEDSMTYKCSIEDRFDFAVKIAVPVIMISAFLSSIFYWVRKKYNKMKNINAVLPEELVSHMPNYHLGFKNVEKDCSSDVSRSNDCLVTQKESHHLLSSICSGSINGANSVTNKNIDDRKDSQNKVAVPPSNACKEEQTSQSTDSVEINDSYALSSNNSTPTRNENMAAICLSLQKDIPVIENMVTLSNGYRKPPASIISDLTCGTLPTTSGGYVLPTQVEMQLPQQPFTFNGYTTLDAMGKCILPNSMETVSSTPKLNDKISEHKETNSKEPDIENTPSGSSYSPSDNSNNNNNNSNLICGYVTQKQLAEFGQLMH